METFYCAGCRFEYPQEKAARIATSVNLDGQSVGFCFVCARELLPEFAGVDLDEDDTLFDEELAEEAASA